MGQWKGDGFYVLQAWPADGDSKRIFNEGCVGLCKVRTGAAFKLFPGSKVLGMLPSQIPGTRAFSSQEDAIKFQQSKGGPAKFILVAVMLPTETVKEELKSIKGSEFQSEVDPKTLPHGKGTGSFD